jgi:hypothetical protein
VTISSGQALQLAAFIFERRLFSESRSIETASTNKLDYSTQLITIKPSSMSFTNINYHS